MKLSNAEIVKRLTGGKFKRKHIKTLNIDYSNKKYNEDDVLKGVNVELEHQDLTKGDLKKTYMIARAHLEENPNYYDLLELLEDPKNYSRLMAMRGEGIRDLIKGEIHALEAQGYGYHCCGNCTGCGGCANCDMCIPNNVINSVGGCATCGGEINLIMQKNTKSITQQIKDAINTMSKDPDKGQIFGSYVYRSQYYPGDIDFHEIINTTPANEKDVYKLAAQTLKDITRDVQKKPNIYFSEIKAGIDQRFNLKIDKEFMANVDNLFNLKLLTLDEYEYIHKLYELFKIDYDSNAYDELKEFFRMKKIIRWSARDVLRGHRMIAGNKKIELVDALKGKSDIKIDIWAPINGRYIELTNFFFLVVFDQKTRDIKILNADVPDYVSGIIEQIQKYNSKLFFNPFKMAKRMWGIARELKLNNLLQLLTPLFQGSAAKINQIIGEIDTIILMYETINDTPDKILNEQIDEFKLRMSYIYDIKYDEDLFYNMVDSVLSTSDKKKRIKILGDIKTFLKDIRNEDTIKYLTEHELYPVPEFIYHLESEKEGGPMDIPLFRKVYGGELRGQIQKCDTGLRKRCVPIPILNDIDRQIRAHKSGRTIKKEVRFKEVEPVTPPRPVTPPKATIKFNPVSVRKIPKTQEEATLIFNEMENNAFNAIDAFDEAVENRDIETMQRALVVVEDFWIKYMKARAVVDKSITKADIEDNNKVLQSMYDKLGQIVREDMYN